MTQPRVGQFRLSHLLVLVAYFAVAFAVVVPLREMDGLEHDWYLTFLVIALPWLTMVFVWATFQAGRFRLRASIVLIWLPELLVMGVGSVHRIDSWDPTPLRASSPRSVSSGSIGPGRGHHSTTTGRARRWLGTLRPPVGCVPSL